MRTLFCSLGRSFTLAIVLAGLVPAALFSQNVVVTGTLSGRITDSGGAVVPAALVVLKNIDTGVEKSTETKDSGLYRFNALPNGSYSLTVSRSGFRSERALVRVEVGNDTLQDFRLSVGLADESITVTGTTPLLRPTESSVSTLLDRGLIDELPLNGRKYTNLTLLAPNTANDGDTGLVSIAGQQGGEDSGYANGNGATSFTVDGTNATNSYFGDILGRYRIPYLYGENAIQEFQVAVSPYSSIYGGGQGFVNTVTRSGSNFFHGEAFYYNRNSTFEANDALSKASGLPKPDDDLQQFGGGVGGPIVRDRLWFFADYEQQLENNPISVINPALATNSSSLGDFLNANFGIPYGTALPAPNGPLPVPGSDTLADVIANPTNPVYLQQVANVINALNTNLGVKSRHRNDYQVVGRVDLQATSRDNLFLSFNVNRFNSPGGVITDPTVGNFGIQTLADAFVRVFQSSVGWTHSFSPTLLNEFHFGGSDDNEISKATGLAPNSPTILLDSPASFTLGNAPFSVGRVFERQWSVADRVDYILGKHTLQFGFDWNRSWDADTSDGGADPNAALALGSFLGSYEFSNLQDFAVGQYNVFSQTAGNPTFSFPVSYYGFYVQDTYRVLPALTLEMGLREDFQVYPQPKENPAFPLTGQYPNQFLRLAPRVGFAWQFAPKTVVRGGFGEFFENINGLNYRNAVVSNGLASQQSSASVSYDTTSAPNQQGPTFPSTLPGDSSLFAASQDISLVSPHLKTPYVLQGSLQVEREIFENTTLSVGTMWNHGVHLLSGTAYDLNLNPLQGTTSYILCPNGTVSLPCAGRTITLPTMDNNLLSEGRINPNLGQINELIGPGQNQYNSLFVELKRRLSKGLLLQASYTFAKSIQRDGLDFNNQFDLTNTGGPSLLDQRHNISIAAVYQPRFGESLNSAAGKALLSGWRLSSVMRFASGRPYAGLLAPACTAPAVGMVASIQCSGANDNLNDAAFNQSTSNTAGGINNAGPSPGTGLNSFYGPWLSTIDMGLARSFQVGEGKQLKFEAQVFNLFNHANFYVQNGNGVNQIQYNPYGATCGDGQSANQTCYLVPNSGAGNFASYQEISPFGLPRAFQFSLRFSF